MNISGFHIFAIASCYMGALIGAGFASGQEILQFFIQFGPSGLLGIVLAGLLFAILGGYTLAYKYKYGIESYGDFLISVLGSSLGKLTDFWISLLLFSGLVIMLAGSTATLTEQFNIPHLAGLILAYIVILWALSTGEKGVLAFNSMLIPLLIVVTITVTILAVRNGKPVSQFQTPSLAGGSWFFAAILYVSYNMITGAVLLSSLKISKPHEVFGGIIGGIGLGILAWAIGIALLCNYREIAILNIPMLYLAKESNWLLNYLYALVIWLAMLTTAVTNIFSLTRRLSKICRLPYIALIVGLLLLASLLTPLGFSRLVATLYPFFGYLGLVLLGGMLLSLGRDFYYLGKIYFKL